MRGLVENIGDFSWCGAVVLTERSEEVMHDFLKWAG